MYGNFVRIISSILCLIILVILFYSHQPKSPANRLEQRMTFSRLREMEVRMEEKKKGGEEEERTEELVTDSSAGEEEEELGGEDGADQNGGSEDAMAALRLGRRSNFRKIKNNFAS